MAGAGFYGPYIVTLVAFSLGISWLALRMGRSLAPAQDQPLRASRIVAQGAPERVAA
jgi:hypothetical protein